MTIASATKRTSVKLVGEDGNVFAIIGRVVQALERNGQNDAVRAYTTRCFNAASYDEVLQITHEYVEVR